MLPQRLLLLFQPPQFRLPVLISALCTEKPLQPGALRFQPPVGDRPGQLLPQLRGDSLGTGHRLLGISGPCLKILPAFRNILWKIREIRQFPQFLACGFPFQPKLANVERLGQTLQPGAFLPAAVLQLFQLDFRSLHRCGILVVAREIGTAFRYLPLQLFD
ncbi:hypothetical protein PUR_21600 [Paenibacillus sp. URB8-2]|nr:hypothetical protein PUR_21600 [Paenibacillus sp. URB8-2]